MPFVADDLKQVTTPELLALIDACAADATVHYELPADVFARLDAQGTHILQAHSIHQDPDSDVIRARTMCKLYDQADGSEIFFLDVREERWHELRDCILTGDA